MIFWILHVIWDYSWEEQWDCQNKKNYTLTELINTMLKTIGLSKEHWSEAILIAWHVLNRDPTKNKESHHWEIGEKSPLFPNFGFLGKGECADQQEM